MKFEVPEPAEWAEYVERGDKNPAKPVWVNEDLKNKNEKSKSRNNNLLLGERRLSKKDKAHMNFIESGKRYR